MIGGPVNIRITHKAPAATSLEVPDFPLVDFDTGMVVYQEALINGQYLVANGSAMGRPKPREWIWQQLSGGATSTRPLRTRQHAFQLEVDGQLLVDRWEWVDARQEDSGRPDCRESVVVLRHSRRPVTVEVHTRIDDTPLLTRRLTITNTGDRHAAVAEGRPGIAVPFGDPAGRHPSRGGEIPPSVEIGPANRQRIDNVVHP